MTAFDLQAALDERRQAHLYRRRRVVQAVDGPLLAVDGRQLVNFCSNDYLGLAQHPEVIAAFKYAADTYGVGAGAAHLISGHSHDHHALEEELAEFTGRPRALLFSTGYMANIGVVTALAGKGDAVFEDRLNHASLIDAGRYCGARWRRFAHGDAQALEKQLAASDAHRKLVLTDGVFSMDGDIAPLAELAETCGRHDAWLMVDDAHGFGVLGERGAGSVAQFGLDSQQVPVLMGTLGKAAGVFGAFVAGSEALIESLIQDARTYVYTTALPPAVAGALRASLRVIRFDSERRERLQARLRQFQQGAQQMGLNLMPSQTPIQPLLVGEAEQALAASEALMERGLWVSAIRPPTVPDGTARLRITLSAMHNEQQVEQLLEALDELLT